MENRVFLRVLLLIGGLILFLALFILIIEPIVGILFLTLVALAFTILWFSWTRMRNTITLECQRIRQNMKNKIGKATQSSIEEYDTAFHPTFQLVYTRHGRNTKTVIDKETFVIGRSNACDLVIPEATVSGKHCRIVYRKYSHTYYLEDLSSNNGTYLGVRRLEPFTQEKLLENASITIADRAYQFTRIS